MKHVCVFAGSSDGTRPEYRATARDLGRALVDRQLGLVYGGARLGLMGVLADAVLAAGGRVTGIIPERLVEKEIAHRGLSELHIVASMHERKARMAELSDGFVALPGGLGTLEELFEVLTWAQLGLHAKPCGLLNVRAYFDSLLSHIDHSIAEGFIRLESRPMLLVSTEADALLEQFERYVSPVVQRWIDPAAI
jgi:hypothetical protein